MNPAGSGRRDAASGDADADRDAGGGEAAAGDGTIRESEAALGSAPAAAQGVEEVRTAGLPGWRVAALECRGARHVFTGRVGGRGNVAMSGGRDRAAAREVRAAWCAFLGVRPEDLVVPGLVHGAEVAVVGESERGRGALGPSDVVAGVDALVTTTPGLPLAMPVADCAAVVLHAAEPAALAVVHAGWRGLAAGVLAATLHALAELGADPAGVHAAVSPAAGPAGYEVGPEVAALAPAAALRPGSGDRSFLDVASWARLALLGLGLVPASVHVVGLDTTADPRLFSHRRDGPGAGRHAAFAVLAPREGDQQASR